MKAHEETWDERGERIDLCEEEKPYGMVAKYMIATFHCHQDKGDCNEAARAKLAAAAPEMARLLLEVQWASQEGDEGALSPQCLFCEAYANARWEVPGDVTSRLLRDDHKPDCKLIAVLRKAGVIADKETRNG